MKIKYYFTEFIKTKIVHFFNCTNSDDLKYYKTIKKSCQIGCKVPNFLLKSFKFCKINQSEIVKKRQKE